MSEPETAFVRIEHIRSDFPALSKNDAQVAAIRQELLEGDRTPVIVRKRSNGGFELLEASNARYHAHLYEDFEHIPVLVAPQNN